MSDYVQPTPESPVSPKQLKALKDWRFDPNTLSWNMGWELEKRDVLKRVSGKGSTSVWELTERGRNLLEGDSDNRESVDLGALLARVLATYDATEQREHEELDDLVGGLGSLSSVSNRKTLRL